MKYLASIVIIFLILSCKENSTKSYSSIEKYERILINYPNYMDNKLSATDAAKAIDSLHNFSDPDSLVLQSDHYLKNIASIGDKGAYAIFESSINKYTYTTLLLASRDSIKLLSEYNSYILIPKQKCTIMTYDQFMAFSTLDIHIPAFLTNVSHIINLRTVICTCIIRKFSLCSFF